MIELPAIANLTIAKRQNDEAEVAVAPEAGEADFRRLLPGAAELRRYVS